jgi:hypothetical protein
MPFLKIDGVRTMNQSGQNAALFDPLMMPCRLLSTSTHPPTC